MPRSHFLRDKDFTELKLFGTIPFLQLEMRYGVHSGASKGLAGQGDPADNKNEWWQYK